MKKAIIWGSIIIILILGGFFAFKKFGKKEEKAPETAEAKIGTIEQIVSATGTVRASKDANLGFKSSGKITNINVAAGDNVEAGQDLAGLDTSDLDSSAMEAEAAVKVAEMQLAEAKTGAPEEDIAVQQVAVSNAEENLVRTKESSDKAIASAKAQVASQQVSVDAKKQALEDAENSAENSLNAAYESGLNTADSKYLLASNAIDTVNDIFNDDDLMDILGNLNYQLRINAIQAKDDANNTFNVLKPYISAADSTKSQSDIDSALSHLESSCDSLGDSFEIIYSALLSTQPMVNITKTELDAYKTSVSAERTNLNSAITSAVSARQAILSAKISNTSNINTAQQALDSAEALLSQYNASLAATEASQAAAVASAEGSLASAKKQLEKLQAAAKPETIAVYEARLSQSRAAYNSILSKYEDRSIAAPADGIVSNIYKEEGENAGASEIIISLIIKDGIEIEADIPESDIVKIGLNNSCDITLDAFSSADIFKGTVVSINPAETVVDGVVYYKIKIIFSEADEKIKPGMTANADILTEKKEEILVIPIRFIQEKSGKSIVKVQKPDGSIEEREIIKGIRGEFGDIEIVSGLSEGERVME